MKELLLGAGRDKSKRLIFDDKKVFENLVTLDNNAGHNPDVLWDLTKHPLPFEDNEFDEIHAYEVLEHLAYQGDYEFFFREFSEYWRILKPGGLFCASVPKPGSVWVWGDPSHRRHIRPETLVFLSQKQYEQQIGVTSMSDFRHIYSADFETVHLSTKGESFYFALRAIK
ncbi:MAG: hypothetical protein DRJ03_03555 [Chloroflexi bacterium]|nr:MAG: hypothetical protein DRJ03_03555 [Chloroflexota bacterium]